LLVLEASSVVSFYFFFSSAPAFYFARVSSSTAGRPLSTLPLRFIPLYPDYQAVIFSPELWIAIMLLIHPLSSLVDLLLYFRLLVVFFF